MSMLFIDNDSLTVTQQWEQLKMQSPPLNIMGIEPTWLPRSDVKEKHSINSSMWQKDHLDIIPYEDGERNENDNLVATSWYAKTNCGYTSEWNSHELKSYVGNITISHKRSKRKIDTSDEIPLPSLKTTQRALTSKAEARDNILNEEIKMLEQTLRSKDPKLGEVHITGCKDLYRQISRCLEHNKCKKNKKKVAAASTYYTLKRFFNPSVAEIEHIFDMDHKAVTDAMKRMRTLAFHHPLEFGWLFEEERGQTNLYRYISQHNMPWDVVPKCFAYAKEHGLNIKDDSVVMNLIKRFSG